MPPREGTSVTLGGMRGLIRLLPAFVILVGVAACQEDSVSDDAVKPGLPLIGWVILVAGTILATWVAISHHRDKKRPKQAERDRYSPSYRTEWNSRPPLADALSVPKKRPVEHVEPKVMTRWHYDPITQREADIIEAIMSPTVESKRKKQSAGIKKPGGKKSNPARKSNTNSSSSKSSVTASEASDAMEFVRLFESLSRLVSDQGLSIADRVERIATRTRTTNGEIWRLRQLRNSIAHDDTFSIAEVRKKSRRIEDLLKIAANQRDAAP